MNLKQLARAKVYAQALVNRAEFAEHGSLEDARLILAAVIELEALKAIPQAIPDAQRAAQEAA